MINASQPYLPLYIGEILTTTAIWSGEARGLYLSLLVLAWASGPLPDSDESLARAAGYELGNFRSLWPLVAKQFQRTGVGLVNERLEELRARAVRLHEQRISASRKGVDARLASQPALPFGAPRGQPPDRPLDTPSGEPDGQPSGSPSQGRAGQGRSEEESRAFEDSGSRAPSRTGSEFHEKVVELFHSTLPDLPRVKVWSRKRRQALDARIRECLARGKPANTLGYWRAFFGDVAQSDFLNGRGKGEWRCDLEWLLRPENFAKTIEGRYQNRTRSNGAAHVR